MLKNYKVYAYPLFFYAAVVYGSMAMMSIGAALVFVLFLYFLISDENFRKSVVQVKKHPLFISTLALTFACVWSLLWAKFSNLSYYGMTPQIEWIYDLKKLWHIFFPFVLYVLIQQLDENIFVKLLKFWLAISLGIAVFAIIQHYVPIYSPMELPHRHYENFQEEQSMFKWLLGKYHATGLAGFHLSFAAIIAFPTCVWIASTAMLLRRRGVSKTTLFFIFGSVLFLLANFFTFSKASMLVIPLVIAGYFISIFSRKWKIVFLSLIIVSMIAVSQIPSVKLRFMGGDTYKERVTVWKANIDMIKTYPIFGVGWHHNSELSESYYKYYKLENRSGNDVRPFISHAHNNFLDQWSSTGTLGLIAFLVWNFIIFKMGYGVFKEKTIRPILRMFALGIIGGFFILHFTGLTQTNFWDAKVMHQMGLMTAILLVLNDKTKKLHEDK